MSNSNRPALSVRETQVLRAYLISHASKASVGRELYVSLGAMNTYLSRIRSKYLRHGRRAASRTALLVRALEDGFVTLQEVSAGADRA